MQRAIHSRFFGIVYGNPQQRDIFGSVIIRVHNINFAFVIGTLKHLVFPFSDMETRRACLRSVTRFYGNQFNAIQSSLVGKKRTLFEYDDFLNRFEAYIYTVPSIDKSALKLFIKIFESKGFYWLENPISRPRNYELWAKYGDYTQYGIVLTEKCLKWQEAEEKTFRNPLIFVKK